MPLAQGASAASGPPLVAQGVLRDAAGHPSRGLVALYHDNMRDHNRLELIASATADASGSFRLALTPGASVRAAAAVNDGYANFALVGVTPSGVSTLHFFSRQAAPNGSWLRADSERVTLAASHPAPSADYLASFRRHVAGALSQVAQPATDWFDYCIYDLSNTWDEATPIQELHTWYTDMSGKALYAHTSTADTDISVGVKLASGPWSIEGSTHIGTSSSTTTEIGRTRTGHYGKVLSSSFRYQRWRIETPNNFVCPWDAPPQIVEATRWNGTNYGEAWDDSRFDGQCATTWSSHRNPMGKLDTWSRIQEDFTSFGYSIGANLGITVNMTSKSGASDKVQLSYATGTARNTYFICGNNEYPSFSLRVFAGS
jgi:hypothetical protein